MTTTLAALEGRLFDAVLFDMDGTLIDSTASVERCWQTWARAEGVEQGAFAGSHGQPAAQLVAALVGPDRAPGALRRIIDLELADTDGIVALPGAVEALAALPRGAAAIVTSCTRDLAAARIAATGLHAPAVVVTADDVRRGKPDPEPFLLGARRLGVDPARCLVVEDAPAGLAAARAAGCATLAVAGTHRLDELTADAKVPDLSYVRFTGAAGAISLI